MFSSDLRDAIKAIAEAAKSGLQSPHKEVAINAEKLLEEALKLLIREK